LKQNTNLEDLNLSENSLFLIDDDFFDELISLKHLYLNANRLEIMSEKIFKNQNNLQSIDLSNNKSINFNIIKLLSNNQEIDYFSLNSLGLNSIDLSNLNQFIHLRKIYLDKNQILKLEGSLKDIDQLYEVSISYNLIREIELNTFVNLHNLQELKLNNNLIENLSVDALSNLENFVFLDISFNRLTSLEWLSSIEFRNLKKLDLSNNRIEVILDDTFLQLGKLEYLKFHTIK
jgi:Leucine-rich repeat (LRR) protein